MAAIGPRSAGPLGRASREPGSLVGSGRRQLRSERGAGVAEALVLELSVLLAALELSVVVLVEDVDESVGAVLFSVDDGSVVVVVVVVVSAGMACVVVVVFDVVADESVDWATAAPMPASRAAAAATADNFF